MGKHKGGPGGAVVNVASVAGLGLKSACPVYDGTKFFVVGYSQSISVSSLDTFPKLAFHFMPLY
jgi:15-hydroxyprostaglandin dehydrogenase (NAD)